MDKQQILQALKKLRESSKKRNFSQSVDLIITLRQLDLKKPEQNINLFLTLPYKTGKEVRMCALVDKELQEQAKTTFHKTMLREDFQKLKPKDIKKMAREYDFFVAQASIMPDIAKFFGRTLGPKGKMPNPKSGCIVASNAQLKPLKEKLEKTIHLQTKNELITKAIVGKESMKDEELTENILAAYNNILHSLPQESQNIKKVLLKLTMSKTVELK